MRKNVDTNFENIIDKLSRRFDSDPYNLSLSEIQMLKWFSQNPGYLGKPKIDKKADLIKTSLFSTFIKKNLESD
jgi:hypothetical protein|tara:strand:+ start:4631 stop:4852 length:222 start_codon:yes stop_codon:yes gene_type:complete